MIVGGAKWKIQGDKIVYCDYSTVVELYFGHRAGSPATLSTCAVVGALMGFGIYNVWHLSAATLGWRFGYMVGVPVNV